MRRKIYVEDNKVVVEVGGAKVRYPLGIIQKRISVLSQELNEWREYERLLTMRATDAEDSAPSQAVSNAETLSTSDGFAVPTRRS